MNNFLEKYAWFMNNSRADCMKAVGSQKPNDFGLFDMLGNSLEWCHDRGTGDAGVPPQYTIGELSEDRPETEPIGGEVARPLRGGSFVHPSRMIRCADRASWVMPSYKNIDIGFRPVRTHGPPASND